MSEFICFIVEGQSHFVEYSKCSKMFLQLEKKGLVFTVQMPDWLTLETFSILQSYLNNALDIHKQYSDQALQRCLWLGDHIQYEQFSETVIRDLILERVGNQNCIIFLNEAFKKLKACEDSPEVWYMMLNVCMNYTAKNLLLIYQTNPNSIAKINQKVVEEILERALKYHRKRNNTDIMEIVFKIKKNNDIVEIINEQKQNIINKKINYQTHPSINWKLSNLSSIIDKETQQFKFSDFTWKLVAKMEERNTLKIYLKLEDIDSELNIRIISLYFQLNLTYTGLHSLKIVNIIAAKGTKVELCEFKGQDLSKYDQQKLEFTVYLNTDQVLTLCLNHLFFNFTPNFNLSKLAIEDCLILLQATPQQQQMQEKSLQMFVEYVQTNKLLNVDFDLYLKSLNLSLMSTDFLTKYLKSPLTQQIQSELDKRQPVQRSFSVSKDSQSSSRILRYQNTGNKHDQQQQQQQSRSQSSEKIFHYEMPVNKLQQLKKTPSMTSWSGGISRKNVFDDINIVNFLKVNDPKLKKELNDLILPYINK